MRDFLASPGEEEELVVKREFPATEGVEKSASRAA